MNFIFDDLKCTIWVFIGGSLGDSAILILPSSGLYTLSCDRGLGPVGMRHLMGQDVPQCVFKNTQMTWNKHKMQNDQSRHAYSHFLNTFLASDNPM